MGRENRTHVVLFARICCSLHIRREKKTHVFLLAGISCKLYTIKEDCFHRHNIPQNDDKHKMLHGSAWTHNKILAPFVVGPHEELTRNRVVGLC